jgi:hypothetical protein
MNQGPLHFVHVPALLPFSIPFLNTFIHVQLKNSLSDMNISNTMHKHAPLVEIVNYQLISFFLAYEGKNRD